MKKPTILMLMIFAISAFSTSAYSQIAVGFAYKYSDKKGCSGMLTGVDYEWVYNPSGNESLSKLEIMVEDKLKGNHSGSNVLTESSKYRYAAIVKYTQKIGSCDKTAYQVGFGDSNSQAADKANAKAKNRCSNCKIEPVAIHAW